MSVPGAIAAFPGQVVDVLVTAVEVGVALVVVGLVVLFVASLAWNVDAGKPGWGMSRSAGKGAVKAFDLGAGCIGALVAALVAIAPHVGRALAVVVPAILRLVAAALALTALWLVYGLRGLHASVTLDVPVHILLYPAQRVAVSVWGRPWTNHVDGESVGSSPRAASMTPEQAKVVRAVERALRQSIGEDMAKHFSYRRHDQTIELDTYAWRATERDNATADALEGAWTKATRAVQRAVGNADAALTVALDPGVVTYLVRIPRPLPPFPSLPQTDLARFIERYLPQLRNDRLSFCIGLDWKAEPVWMRLDDAAPSFLVGGAQGSGKSASGLFAPLAQLCASNTPEQLEITLIDSTKREVTPLLKGSPYLRQSVIATDGDEVVEALAHFAASMDAWYEANGGRKWNVNRDPIRVLVVEECADLRDLLDKAQAEAVTKSIKRINQTGRAAGYRVFIVTQRAAVETVPGNLKAVLKARISGYFASSNDSACILDDYEVGKTLPNEPGRLLVKTATGIVQVQGLYSPDRVLKRLLRGQPVTDPASVPENEPAFDEPDPEAEYAPEPGENAASDPASDDEDGVPSLPTKAEMWTNPARAAAVILVRSEAHTGEVISVERLGQIARNLGLRIDSEWVKVAIRQLSDRGVVAQDPATKVVRRVINVPIEWSLLEAMTATESGDDADAEADK